MLRLEFLDYPGEWLLDLPLLTVGFVQWSAAMLRRLEPFAEARGFLSFVHGLPKGVAADDAVSRRRDRRQRADVASGGAGVQRLGRDR